MARSYRLEDSIGARKATLADLDKEQRSLARQEREARKERAAAARRLQVEVARQARDQKALEERRGVVAVQRLKKDGILLLDQVQFDRVFEVIRFLRDGAFLERDSALLKELLNEIDELVVHQRRKRDAHGEPGAESGGVSRVPRIVEAVPDPEPSPEGKDAA